MYSRIIYSTQILDTELKDMILDFGYVHLDTQLNIHQQFICNIWKSFKTIKIRTQCTKEYNKKSIYIY